MDNGGKKNGKDNLRLSQLRKKVENVVEFLYLYFLL